VVLDVHVRPVDRRFPPDPLDPIVAGDHDTFGQDAPGEPDLEEAPLR
jgi:hypothetical protein